MARTLAELAERVAGTLLGDGAIEIVSASPRGTARPGDITLIDSAEKLQRFGTGDATAAIVPRGVVPGTLPAIQVDDVHAAFTKIVALFRPPRPRTRRGISPLAIVSPTAGLADDVDVHPGATIGDDVEIGTGSTIHSGVHILAGCKLGPGVTVFPNVVLYENSVIGARVIIHATAVVGAYGFGYKVQNGKHQLSAQLGYVEIGDDVEIGAGTTIDRGTYGPTIIGEGTKIDNQVMIAHNCRLGKHNLICSQVGIAGSTTTGDYVVMAGQAGVRDHVHIGDYAVLGAKAGVHGDVPDGVSMLGCPATPLREQQLMMGAYAKLPDMRRQLKALEATVQKLLAAINPDGKAAA
jgi:UDP-3-O-[3-hydroxymyristoyl] glucosamine N-acyltransferase